MSQAHNLLYRVRYLQGKLWLPCENDREFSVKVCSWVLEIPSFHPHIIEIKINRHSSSKMARKSSTRCCVFPEVNSPGFSYGATPVYLNVYDLSPMNGYLYWAGVGVFHSGVEVNGAEYAFGAIDYPASGIFEVEPRRCPGYRFRKSFFIGTTFLNPFQVQEFMKDKVVDYYGHTYHVVRKNCNHFSEDICYKLTGNSIPKWVNRLARIGSYCDCVIPEDLELTNGCHEDNYKDPDSEKRNFTCF